MWASQAELAARELAAEQTAMWDALQAGVDALRAERDALLAEQSRLAARASHLGADGRLALLGRPLWLGAYVPSDVALLVVAVVVAGVALTAWAARRRRRASAKELELVSAELQPLGVDAGAALRSPSPVPASPRAAAAEPIRVPPPPPRGPCAKMRGDPLPLHAKEVGVRHREGLLRRPLRAGDIVLCQTKTLGGRLQRLFTAATWDHVAVVVRGRGRRFYLFEATSEGVTLAPLLEALEVYRVHSTRLMLRQLETPEPQLVADRLRAFVIENCGKPYQFFSPRKMWSSSSSSSSAGSPAVGGRRDDAYFCSELIACALREMGVLSPTANTSGFWPGAFRNGGELEKTLCPGVTLAQGLDMDCCVFASLRGSLALKS